MGKNYYETEQGLSEYLLLHYGERDLVLPYEFGPREALAFPCRCVLEFMEQFPAVRGRALDLGCAVGRSSFELARCFDEVLGLDNSASFIAAARELQAEGKLPFRYRTEGELTAASVALVPDDLPRHRARFEVCDAQEVPAQLGQFDLVLMSNLLDRLSRPAQCLQQMERLVRSGGALLLTSPYTWTTQYTPPENWLGGFTRNGHPVTTLETLKELLAAAFNLVQCKDLPFLIREHARKFQWSVAQATLWTRKQEA